MISSRSIIGLTSLNQRYNIIKGILAIGTPSVSTLRFKSTNANESKRGEDEEAKKREGAVRARASYWGITQTRHLDKNDGSEWKWNCFKVLLVINVRSYVLMRLFLSFLVLDKQPSDTYKPDMSIDLKKHHNPTNLMDKLALWTVKALRIPTDLFFKVNNCL